MDRLLLAHPQCAKLDPQMEGAQFKDVTKEKSKRQLFVLTDSTGGAVLHGRKRYGLSPQRRALHATQFEKSDKHTDLELHLTLRSDKNPGEIWPTYAEDLDCATSALVNLREKAIRSAMMPIFEAGKTMTGMNASQMKRFQKHSKNPEKLYEALDEAWGGVGMNANRDIARFKRRCYNQSDLENSREFMDNWLQVRDENGDELDYIRITRRSIVATRFYVVSRPCSVHRREFPRVSGASLCHAPQLRNVFGGRRRINRVRGLHG